MSSALYDSFIADYYDASPVVAGRTQDIAFYRSATREFGDPVLELGCGTDRVAMQLAEDGYRVTGLDRSERMLERAAQKRAAFVREARERVHFVQGDMTGFNVGEKFRLIIIPFRPFQHLAETHQQVNCLLCARKHLARRGRLIVDFFSDGRVAHARPGVPRGTICRGIRNVRRAARQTYGARGRLSPRGTVPPRGDDLRGDASRRAHGKAGSCVDAAGFLPLRSGASGCAVRISRNPGVWEFRPVPAPG